MGAAAGAVLSAAWVVVVLKNGLLDGRSWPPVSTGRERAADQDLLDVAGALVDLADAHVAVDAFHRKVAHVAVAAVDLDRVRAYPLSHLGGEELGHRRFLEARAS